MEQPRTHHYIISKVQSAGCTFPFISAEIMRIFAHNTTGDIMKYFFEGMLCGVLNGLFGSGGGVAAVPILEHEQRKLQPELSPADAMKHAHADSVALIFVLSITAAVCYMFSGGIDFATAFSYVPWGAGGALAGAFFLRRIRAVWLQRLFGALICAAAVRSLLS